MLFQNVYSFKSYNSLSITLIISFKYNTEADSVSAMSVFYRQPTDIKVKKEIVRASNYLSMQIQTTKNGKSERVSVPVEFTLSNNLKEKHPLTCGFLVENKQR